MRTSSTHNSPNVLLYRMVFATRWVSACALLLLISILIQPVERAFAQEATPETAPEAESTVEEASPEPEPEPDAVEEEPESDPEEAALDFSDGELVEEQGALDETTNDPTSDDETIGSTNDSDNELNVPVEDGERVEEADSEDSTHSSTASATESSEASNTLDASGGSTGPSSSESIDDNRASGTSETTATTSEETMNEERSTSTDEGVPPESASETNSVDGVVVDNQVADDSGVEETVDTNDVSGGSGVSSEMTEATTTASTTENYIPEPIYITQAPDANKPYQFSEGECVLVDDGSYYCSKNTGIPDLDADRIYAAPDEDGDLEVFMHLNGVTEQITHNRVDDAAPEYDALSERIVWHRLSAGRYRIVVYGVDEHEEYELTTGQFNSMEPTVQGDYIAWQAWDGSDWEIMLYDGETTIALSDNDAPDIAPSIHDGYVMWTTTGINGEHAAKVYDISSGATEVIEGTDGGAIRNPRFVLVYDTLYENGDIMTQGFDLETGTIAPLAALPTELPQEIPDPEPTEEVKALISIKSSKEDAEEFDIIPNPTPEPTATGTESADDIDMIEPVIVDEPFELSEYDVLVTNFATTSQQ